MWLGISFFFVAYVIHSFAPFWYIRAIMKLPKWLYKPLGGCLPCMTGQLTLWGCLPFVSFNYESILFYVGIICLNITLAKYITYVEED